MSLVGDDDFPCGRLRKTSFWHFAGQFCENAKSFFGGFKLSDTINKRRVSTNQCVGCFFHAFWSLRARDTGKFAFFGQEFGEKRVAPVTKNRNPGGGRRRKLQTTVHPPNIAPITPKICTHPFQNIPHTSFFKSEQKFRRQRKLQTTVHPPNIAPIPPKSCTHPFQNIPHTLLEWPCGRCRRLVGLSFEITSRFGDAVDVTS